MITVKFTIPEVAGKFTDLTPKLYVWLAYFWGDIHTLASPQPVSVFVPPSNDTRYPYPEFPQALVAVPIPAQFGQFQVNLDDAGMGFDAAGVLALVFGQHDTPDDAIAAGYSVFGTAVAQQLNDYVSNNGATTPTPDQIHVIADAIKSSVTNAISNKLSDWDKFLTWIDQETQDEFIGYSYAFFGPGGLNPPQDTPLNLPPIEKQIEYTFPFAKLDVTTYGKVDPCQPLVIEVNQAMTAVTELINALRQLQSEYAAADNAQRAALRYEIKKLQSTEIPAAKRALSDAQRALMRCRMFNSMIGVSNVNVQPST